MSRNRLSIVRQLLAAIVLAACSEASWALQNNKFFNGSSTPLDGLQAKQELSVSEAQVLADSGQPLMLQLIMLNEDIAEVLARSRGNGLSLRRLSTISEPAAVALASWSGAESGTGLYAGKQGRLHLGLFAIPDEVAEALSEARCTTLEIGSSVGKAIPSISVKAANSLSRYPGNLTIHVEFLPIWAERAFAESEATLRLPRLRSFTLSRLLEKLVADASGHFEIAVEELNAENAAIIAEHELQTLRLPGIKKLSPEVAEILANSKAKQISLTGLKECPPGIRSVLERHKGISLP